MSNTPESSSNLPEIPQDEVRRTEFTREHIQMLVTQALSHHSYRTPPKFLEYNEREPRAVRFIWHGTEYRVSQSLSVDVADRSLCIGGSPEADLMEILLNVEQKNQRNRT
jgi:hypothetical protein